MTPKSKQRLVLTTSGVVLTLLLAAVFTLGSLDVPFEPKSWRVLLTLFAVSTFITAAFIVFLLILIRTTFRLWMERSRQHLGARFKTKMVVGAMGISLLPILFMFFVSYSLLNRTLARWFPRPLEIAAEQSRSLQEEMAGAEYQRLTRLAAAWNSVPASASFADQVTQSARCNAADAYWRVSPTQAVDGFHYCWHNWKDHLPNPYDPSAERPPALLQKLPSGAELWSGEGQVFIAARASLAKNSGYLYAARSVPSDFASRLQEIQSQSLAYDQEKQHLRALK